MSSGAEVAIVLPLIVVAPAALAVAGVTMVAAATIGAALAFEQEYERARLEYQARQAAERAQQDSVIAADRAMVAGTRVEAIQDASAAFLRESVAGLLTRVPDLPDSDLGAQCRALQAEVVAQPAQAAEHLARYYVLARAVREAARAAHAEDAPALSAAVADEFAELHQALDSPLFTQADARAVRAQLLADLQSYEQIAATQPTLVKQGLRHLANRIHDEVTALAAQATNRAAAAAELRRLVGAALPQLQTIAAQTSLPAEARQAEALLRELATLLAHATTTAATVAPLVARAEALFTRTRAQLTQAATQATLATTVSDVLLGMGYRVAQVPGEDAGHTTLVAPLGGDLGVEFTVDGEGRLVSEAIALGPAATTIDAPAQEHVCSLVDQVLEHLRARQCTVRERSRRPFKAGHRLRAVQIAATTAPPADTAPKQQRMDD